MGAGVFALGIYGFVATLQPDAHFGQILAAYGGIFVAGSLLWGMVWTAIDPTGGTSSARDTAPHQSSQHAQ
jgi:small multidrug resistance family-3 protein